jgi:hypothetical protein
MDASERDYWLGHCDGFDAEFTDGRIGTVHYVRYHSSCDRPDWLVIRLGLGDADVPIALIESIDPDLELVQVGAPHPATGAPAAWATGQLEMLRAAWSRARRTVVRSS